jgi:hypothetical protein
MPALWRVPVLAFGSRIWGVRSKELGVRGLPFGIEGDWFIDKVVGFRVWGIGYRCFK